MNNKKIESIAILIAMEDEAKPLINELNLTLEPHFYEPLPFKWYRGQDGPITVSIVVSGKDERYQVDNIGTQAATLMAQCVIEKLKPDLLISAGTAGGFAQKGAKIGTVYLSQEKFVFHDRRVPLPQFDESAIGHYPALDVSRMAKELSLPTGIVSSGSSLEKSDKDIEVIERFNAVAKEMEAAAIAWVCSLHNMPLLAIKSITNCLDEPSASEEQFVNNLNYSCDRLRVEMINVLRYCHGKSIMDLS